MLKKIAGLFIILLVIPIGGVSASLEKEITPQSFKTILAETSETPLPRINNTETNSSVDVIVSYVQSNFNDRLTEAELGCLLEYYYQQLNLSSTFNLDLYADYLKNSSEHPISSIGLTARELYDQVPDVHDFAKKDDVI
jgi:hypothetical protein